MILRIFVAGPYIDKGWTSADLITVSPSAKLRLHLIKAIEAVNHQVVIGEHRGVIEMAEKSLRSTASVMIAEIELATTRCEAIVIIPDSPGSFCELGSWAMHPALCSKMIILGNKNYESSPSYVGKGVFKVAEDEGARILWADYDDQSAVEAEVIRFIDSVHDRTLARRIKAGNG